MEGRFHERKKKITNEPGSSCWKINKRDKKLQRIHRLKQYDQIIREQLSDGILELATYQPTNGGTFHIKQ